MKHKSGLYIDESGDYRWRIVSHNGNILADSGEGYKNKQECLDQYEKVTKSIFVIIMHDNVEQLRYLIQNNQSVLPLLDVMKDTIERYRI